jgi:hypothetical protein
VTRLLAQAAAVAVALAAGAGVAHAAPLAIRATAQPASVGVGDVFTYVVEVRVDPKLVDPAGVRIVADSGPFAPLGPAVRSTHGRSGDTLVRLTERFACLDLACAPRNGVRAVTVPAARVRARLRGGGLADSVAAQLTVSVVPRVPAAAVRAERAPYRRQTALPPPGSAPGRLAGGAGAVALLLAAVCLVLVVAALRAGRAAAFPRRDEEPLARAVRLLRESALRSVADRRRAADLLARVARARNARPLADDATRVAWSPEGPELASAATTLADRAEPHVGADA